MFLRSTNIKVILKDDVPGTGYRGEYVEVKAGFMRNYLFPKKRAMYATEENKFLYESVDRVSQPSAAVVSTYLVASWFLSFRDGFFTRRQERSIGGNKTRE